MPYIIRNRYSVVTVRDIQFIIFIIFKFKDYQAVNGWPHPIRFVLCHWILLAVIANALAGEAEVHDV